MKPQHLVTTSVSHVAALGIPSRIVKLAEDGDTDMATLRNRLRAVSSVITLRPADAAEADE